MAKLLVQCEDKGGENVGGTRTWVENLQGERLSLEQVLSMVATYRLKGEWGRESGQYLNANKGTHWGVTGSGDGNARGWELSWNLNHDNDTEGTVLWEARLGEDGRVTVAKLGLEDNIAARKSSAALGVPIVQQSCRGGNCAWVESLEGRRLGYAEVMVFVARGRLKGSWNKYSGEYFNMYKGTHWCVAGNGDGTASAQVTCYPDACPSDGDSYSVEVRLGEDGQVCLVHTDSHSMADYDLKQAGILK